MTLRNFSLEQVERDIRLIPQEDRVKLAILLVRDVERSSCVSLLRRLSNEAAQNSDRILRSDLNRECG